MFESFFTILTSVAEFLGTFFGAIWDFGKYFLLTIALFLTIRHLFGKYLKIIREEYIKNQAWTFLSVRIPKINELSTLAVEQVFSQIHAIIQNPTFAQNYIEGFVQPWYSFEIISLGGKISFIVRAPEKYKQLVQSAIYSQYPEAEVTEVGDYLEKLEPEMTLEKLEMWGTELQLQNDDALPIKTYRDFEHMPAKEKIVDPLRPLFEGLANISPNELFAAQILIEPVKDSAWKPKGEIKAQQLIAGTSGSGKTSILQKLLNRLSPKSKSPQTQERNFSTLSDVEKERVNSVLRKVGKPGYRSLVRMIYIAPPGNFKNEKTSIFLGAFSTVSSANANGFAPNPNATPKINYKLIPFLERPYVEHQTKKRKVALLKKFLERDFGHTSTSYILNIEELSTIYHLPLIGEEERPQEGLEVVASRKSQPPANLPIGEY